MIEKELNQLLDEKAYLIKSCIKRLNIYKNYDDFYQVGMIALLKAIKKYRGIIKDNEEFNIYAYYTIMNALKNELSRMNRQKRIDDLIMNQHEDSFYSFQEQSDHKLVYEAFLERLNDEEKNIMELRRIGFKNSEIAEALRISDEQLKYKIKLIKKKLEKYYK